MIPVISGRIAGAAGETISFDLHPPAEDGPWPLVALCHGFKGFKDWGFFPFIATTLADAGIAALRINFSHNGASLDDNGRHMSRADLFERDRMSYRLLDLAETLRHVLATEHRIDGNRLGIFGHSLGGAVALLAMKSLPFRALVTLASIDRAGFLPEEEAILDREGRLPVLNRRTGQMMMIGRSALLDLRAHRDEYDLEAAASLHGKPWLIVHGGADASVPVEAAHRLHSSARPGTARLEIIDGADHSLDCQHPFPGPTRSLDQFMALAIPFFRHSLANETSR